MSTAPTPPSSGSACATCGSMIPPAAPFGQCPRCLLSFASSIDLAPDASAEDLASSLPRPFGNYQLLEEISRGGMGVVYRARQPSLQREVALKMILAGELAGADSLRQFRREAHAAANLHHPHIIPIHEIGEHDRQPYFTMRLIPGGRTIADWARTCPGNWTGFAAAVAQAARAVAHAHTHGVLHRDLKPSNILWDDALGPQVADFGLAKILGDGNAAATATARVLGSPNYMAPEQAAGRPGDVTTASDVHGLGAVLYELLAGHPPFQGSSAIETLHRALHTAPPPLPHVPRDLATVCLKCLAKLPSDRYRSAASLADELERFVRGDPVLAVPLSPAESAARWARRHPQFAGLLGVTILSLAAGVAGITWQWRVAEQARRGERSALEKATATVVDLHVHSGLTADKDGEPARAALWFAAAANAARDPAARHENLLRHAAWREAIDVPVQAFRSEIGLIARLYWNHAQTALIGLTWDLKSSVWEVASGARWKPDLALENAAWSHEGSWLVLAASNSVQILDFPSGRPLASAAYQGHSPAFAVSRDDALIAVGGDAPFVWQWKSNVASPLPALPDQPRLLEFSPDGSRLLVCRRDQVSIHATTNPAAPLFPPLPCLPPSNPGWLDNSHFCNRPVTELTTVHDATDGRVTESYKLDPADRESTPRQASPDGRFIATSLAPLIHRPRGYTTFPIHENRIEQADFSRDGSLLATAGYDSVVRLVHLPEGRRVDRIGWHQEGALGVAISPDHRLLAISQAGDQLVRVWRRAHPPTPRRIPVSADTDVRLSPDGRYLLPTGSTLAFVRSEKTRVHAVDTGEPAGPEIIPGGIVLDGGFAPDASWVVLATSHLQDRSDATFQTTPGSGEIQFWDFRAGHRLGESIPWQAEPRAVAVHPTGRWVASFTSRRELLEIDVATREVRVLHSTTNNHYSSDICSNGRCQYSPDGRYLAAWAMRSPPVLWDRQAARLIPAQPDGPSQVTDVQFHNGILSMVSMESRIEFLDLASGRPVRTPLKDNDWLFIGRFNPGGDLLLTAGRARVAHVWDWRKGTLLFPAHRQSEEIFSGLFLPGTDAVFTGDANSQLHCWSARTGLPLRPQLETDARGLNLTLTPDHRLLVQGNSGGCCIQLHDLRALLPEPTLEAEDALLQAEIEAAAEIRDGRLEPLSAIAWMEKWREFGRRHPAGNRW